MSPKTLQLVALCLISLLLAAFLGSVPVFGIFLMVLAFASFLALGRHLMLSSVGKRYRDPYDLNLLREVHERKDFEGVDEIEVDPHADVVCPHCGHSYGYKFKVCPRCGRSP